jgi:hypothetical protein
MLVVISSSHGSYSELYSLLNYDALYMEQNSAFRQRITSNFKVEESQARNQGNLPPTSVGYLLCALFKSENGDNNT